MKKYMIGIMLMLLVLQGGVALASEQDILEITSRGDDEYRGGFTNILGEEYDFPIVSNENGVWKFGDEEDALHFTEALSSTGYIIRDDDYFVVSNDHSDQTSVTSVLKYEDYDATEHTLEFEDRASGDVILVPVDEDGVGYLAIAGHTHEVRVSERTADEPTLVIDLNADGKYDGTTVALTAQGGVVIEIGPLDDSVEMTMRLDGENSESLKWTLIPAPYDNVQMEFDESDYEGPSGYDFELTYDGDWGQGVTAGGVFVQYHTPGDDDDPHELFLSWAGEEEIVVEPELVEIEPEPVPEPEPFEVQVEPELEVIAEEPSTEDEVEVPAAAEEVPETTVCVGCLHDDRCFEYGMRANIDGPMYCGIGAEFKQQVATGTSCQNDFECLSNQCSNGVCIDIQQELEEQRSILGRILDWFKGLF